MKERRLRWLPTALAVLVSLTACSDDDKSTATGPATTFANLRVIHASFDAPAMDILIDNAVGINALTYGEASGYVKVSAGNRNIKVVPDGAATPVALETVIAVTAGSDFTVVAMDRLDAMTAVIDDDARSPVTDKAKVRFVHAVTDVPTIDIKLNSGSGPSLFTGQTFGGISAYQQLDGGAYTFALTDNGSPIELGLFNPFTFQNGMVYTVVALGTLDPVDPYPLIVRVFVDNGAGDQYVDLGRQTQFAGVRVIHTSYDAPAVDVLVDDAMPAAIPNLAYGGCSGYAELESGFRNIKVVGAGTAGPAVIDVNLTLAANTDYTVLAVDAFSQITAISSADSRTPDPTMAKIRFVHASPDAPAIDVKRTSGSGTVVFGNAAFPSIGAYSTMSAGAYALVITETGSATTLAEFQPVTVSSGAVYSLVAYGTLDPTDAYPFGVRMFDDTGEGDQYVDLTPYPATLRVIHASYDGPSVDVVLDDSLPPAIANLAYSASSGYTGLEPGLRNVKVVPAGSAGAAMIDMDMMLSPRTDYTVFAIDDWSMLTAVVETDARTPDLAQARLRFAHVAPDASALDLKLSFGNGPTLFGNRSFGSVTAYSGLAAGDYQFVLTAAGDNLTIVKFEPIALAAGAVYTVMAYGTLDSTDAYPFSIRLFIDDDAGDQFIDPVALPPAANVRVIHAGYDAPNIDLLVADPTAVAIADLTYLASSGYVEIAAGDRNVTVVESGTVSPPLLDTTFALAVKLDYTMVVVDGLAMLDAVLVGDSRTAAPSQAKIRFVHAVPDAPAVDVKVNSGSGPALFTNRAFKTVTGYSAVTPGTYVFSVTPTGDTAELVRFEPVTLAAGNVYTILAYGTLDANDVYAFGGRLFVDTGAGDQHVDLVAQMPGLRVIHLGYDSPPVDVLIDNATPPAYSDLTYLESSGYTEFPTGTHNCKIVPSGAVTPSILDVDLPLAPAIDYTLFAMDALAMIDAVTVSDARTPSGSNAKVRLVHGSPDLGSVDIKLDSGAGASVFINKAFKSVSGYSSLAAGNYSFVITAVGDTVTVISFAPVPLAAGTVYSLAVYGTHDSNDGYPLGARLFIDSGAGDQYTDLAAQSPVR